MAKGGPKRKTYNTPGHAHELTFSVYRRARLLQGPVLCRAFLRNLDRARKEHRFEVWAYAIMPDHVHLLLWPTQQVYDVALWRSSIKQPFSRAVARRWRKAGDRRYSRIRHATPKGVWKTSFWQPGPGYDRNIHSTKACMKVVDYIHNNPVELGLARVPWEYEFSSAAWYQGLRPVPFEVDRARY